MKVPVRIYNTSGGGQYDVPPEGDIVAWAKSEGDRIEKGDTLCEIEIEKTVIPIVAPMSGILTDIAYAAKSTWIRAEVAEIIDHVPRYDPPLCWIETDAASIASVVRESRSNHISSAPDERNVVIPTPINVVVAHGVPEPQSNHVLPEQDRHAPVMITHNEPRKKRSRMSAGPFQSIEEARKAKPRMSMGALRLAQEEKISHEELFDFFGENVGTFTEYHIKRLLEKRDGDIQQKRDEGVKSYYRDFAVTSDSVQSKTIKAVPLARAIAREKEIDLISVQGTGPDGLILASDVENKVGKQAVHQEVRADQPMTQESEEPILLSMPRLWRTIAKNMEAASRMPTADIRVDGRRFNIRNVTEFYRANRQSYKLGLWLPLMVAYARILSREPFVLFNSYWHEEIDSAGKIIPYIAARRYVNMGIAYDRGEAPVIDWDNKTIQGERLRILTVRNVHRMSLAEIVSEVTRLFDAAIQKKFSLQDTSGHTAIFNNIGVLGHHSGRAILTQGIASELNMGFVDLESGEAVIQLVLDHRLIDGAMTTAFFRALYKELTQCVLPELEALLSEKK